EPDTTSTVVDGITYISGTVRVRCTPRVGMRQRVRLLLNEKDPPAQRPALAYSFDAPDGNGIVEPDASTDEVGIAYRHVAQASYLARVQVDAGISPLELGPDGRFSSPEVSL